MLTAAVVIWPPREYKLSRKGDTYNPSDISNGLRFRGVDRKFWHSPAASANGVNYLTGGKRTNRSRPGRNGFIRVKFKLFSFLGNIRRIGDSHAFQSRRRQNPGDQGTRDACAPAARISLLGENRGAGLQHAPGDSPRPSRIGRSSTRDHRPVIIA